MDRYAKPRVFTTTAGLPKGESRAEPFSKEEGSLITEVEDGVLSELW